MPRSRVAALLAAGMVLVIGGQHLLLSDAGLPGTLLVWITGLAMVVALAVPVLPLSAYAPAEPVPVRPPLRPHQRALLTLSALAALTTGLLVHGRPESEHFTDATITWVISMGALVAAAAGPTGAGEGRPRPARWEPWALLGLVITAALPRIVAIDRYPVVLDADGYSLAMEARAVRQGILTDPFTTGFLDNPVLFSFLQRASMAVFGETAEGAMALGIIAGTATVALTYVLARRLAGPSVAVMAAAVLAAVHAHVHFSRSPLNVVEDSFWVVAGVLLLDLGVAGGRRWACALAGMSIGLAQYFYFSGRFTVPLALAVVGWLAVRRYREGIAGVPEAAAWIGAGAIVAFLPLGLHYVEEPKDYTKRLETVSFVGNLGELEEATGDGRTVLAARQVRAAVLLPFETEQESTFFHPAPPLVGWALAPWVALGVAVVTATPGRRRHGVLMLWWWGAIAGVGLTMGVYAQRWIVAWPLVAIVAAIGLDVVGRVLVRRMGVGRRLIGALGAAAVTAIMATNLDAYFRPGNEVTVYGDFNSLIATELARSLQQEPAGTTVVMVTAPRMTFDSHSTVRFLAPHVDGQDVLDSMRSEDDVPATAGPTVFVFLPERDDELTVVRAVRPGGRTDDVRARDGSLLYTSYTVDG